MAEYHEQPKILRPHGESRMNSEDLWESGWTQACLLAGVVLVAVIAALSVQI
jgi:hypothetical protein